MLPRRLVRSRQFPAAVLSSLLLFASLYGSVFFLSQFMQTGLGHEPLQAGLLLIPWTGMLLLVAPVAGALADRIGERPLALGGAALAALGLAALAWLAHPALPYWQLPGVLVVSGVGSSVAIPVLQAAVIGAVDPDDVGTASGVGNMAQELGGALGVASLVAVFAAFGGTSSSAAFVAGFAPAMAVCAVIAAAAAAAALLLAPKPGPTEAFANAVTSHHCTHHDRSTP